MNTAAIAVVVTAAARRRREREEELMTTYTPKDLAEGWEFKILRSTISGFRRPERLRAVLEEEARAGWTLVEKFDNCRIRLKRPSDARKNDASLDQDPYRTQTDALSPLVFWVALGIAVAGILIPLLLLAASHV
jgi:hypothetical protein